MYLGEPFEVVWFEEKYNALSILFSVFLWDLSPKKKKSLVMLFILNFYF